MTQSKEIEKFNSEFTEYGNGLLMNTKKAPLIKQFITDNFIAKSEIKLLKAWLEGFRKNKIVWGSQKNGLTLAINEIGFLLNKSDK